MNNETTAQIYWVGIRPKEFIATITERPNFLAELKAETYYGLRTMEKKFKQIQTGGEHINALQTTTIYYVKYRNEESEDKELINIKGVAEVTAIEGGEHQGYICSKEIW